MKKTSEQVSKQASAAAHIHVVEAVESASPSASAFSTPKTIQSIEIQFKANAKPPLPFPHHRLLDAQRGGGTVVQSFPEARFVEWLQPRWVQEQREGACVAPTVWDATIPSGRAYWLRLYPWGGGFTLGRKVLVTSELCAALFSPTDWLNNFESKSRARKLAQRCGIRVTCEVDPAEMFDDLVFLQQHNCLASSFCVKPNCYALSEGVLLASLDDKTKKWTLSTPPMARSDLWDSRFRTSERLMQLQGFVLEAESAGGAAGSGSGGGAGGGSGSGGGGNIDTCSTSEVQTSSVSARQIAAAWMKSYSDVETPLTWVIQERVPGVSEFGGSVMEIKVYVLGGKAWLANHAVQTDLSTGSIKHPVVHVDPETGSWRGIPIPEGSLPMLDESSIRGLSSAVLSLVANKLAPAAELLAAEVGARFMMRADFFVFPRAGIMNTWSLASVLEKYHHHYSGNGGSNLEFSFNEMQHHMGKSFFTQPDHGIDFLWPSFQATVNSLLREANTCKAPKRMGNESTENSNSDKENRKN